MSACSAVGIRRVIVLDFDWAGPPLLQYKGVTIVVIVVIVIIIIIVVSPA